MYQVGTTVTFTVTSVPVGQFVYVWDWWDGTVTATSTPVTTKVLNIGGAPNDGNLLRFRVTIVAQDGQSVVKTGSIQVNNPPTIAQSPTISVNDLYFPFTTTVVIRAYDVENNLFDFLWYNGNQPIGGGTSGTLGLISGTYAGTVGVFNGTINTYSRTVNANETITAKLVDSAGGTTVVDFSLRGGPAPLPSLTATAEASDLTADATTLPDHRIGAGRTVNFVVYASDVSESLQFTWSFYGTNGWAANSFSNGLTLALAAGAFKNSVDKDISGETGGPHRAIVTVLNTATGKSIDVPVDVTLIANTMATTITFQVFKESIATETELDLSASHDHEPDEVAIDDKVRFVASAGDPEGDIVTYKWEFLQPVGVLPATLKLWGRSVTVTTVDYPSGSSIRGVVTAIDRFGGQLQVATPTVIVR